jgi:hypothetical protein
MLAHWKPLAPRCRRYHRYPMVRSAQRQRRSLFNLKICDERTGDTQLRRSAGYAVHHHLHPLRPPPSPSSCPRMPISSDFAAEG